MRQRLALRLLLPLQNGPLVADIVQFAPKAPEELVWRCSCGCISFELRADGDAICVQCETAVTGADGSWRAKLPEPVTPVEPLGDGDVTITDLNSSGAALRRIINRIDADKTALVIVIQQDGTVSTWGESIEGEAQSAWFDRRLDTVKQMMVKEGRDK